MLVNRLVANWLASKSIVVILIEFFVSCNLAKKSETKKNKNKNSYWGGDGGKKVPLRTGRGGDGG